MRHLLYLFMILVGAQIFAAPLAYAQATNAIWVNFYRYSNTAGSPYNNAGNPTTSGLQLSNMNDDTASATTVDLYVDNVATAHSTASCGAQGIFSADSAVRGWEDTSGDTKITLRFAQLSASTVHTLTLYNCTPSTWLSGANYLDISLNGGSATRISDVRKGQSGNINELVVASTAGGEITLEIDGDAHAHILALKIVEGGTLTGGTTYLINNIMGVDVSGSIDNVTGVTMGSIKNIAGTDAQ